MISGRMKEGKTKENRLHSSRVPSPVFQNLLERFCIQYNLYPSFIIISDPDRRFLRKWGQLPLPRIPKEGLHCDTKYWFFVGLGYHAFAPRTEYNRIMLRTVASNLLKNLSTDAPAISWLSGMFCTLLTFTTLSRNEKWENIVQNAISWKARSLEEKKKSVIREFVRSYFEFLKGNEPPSQYSNLVKRSHNILKRPTNLRRKAEDFIALIKDIIKGESSTLRSFRRKIKDFAHSVGSPYGFKDKETWGENWRAREREEKDKLSSEELSKIAQINQERAMRLAKAMQKDEEKKKKVKKEKKAKTKSFLPRYSKRQRMIQQLLSKRRYIAAVRKVRLKRLLKEMGEFEGNRSMEISGRTTWTLGDDPEDLEIERSMENYSKLIPNLTTLKNVWTKSTSGKKKGGGRHIELLIDTSGSMEGKTLERAIDVGLALTEKAKSQEDYVGLTTFSSGAWEGFPPCRSYNAIQGILLRLMATGGTNIRHALELVEDHFAQADFNSTLFLISDTAIWDANYPVVREKLKEWSGELPLFLIALTSKIYKEIRRTLEKSNVKVLKAPPWKKAGWELALSKYGEF